MYVVRNRNGSLFLCKWKPYKNDVAGFWYTRMTDSCIFIDALDSRFDGVKWEDKEPTEIEITIKQ